MLPAVDQKKIDPLVRPAPAFGFCSKASLIAKGERHPKTKLGRKNRIIEEMRGPKSSGRRVPKYGRAVTISKRVARVNAPPKVIRP